MPGFFRVAVGFVGLAVHLGGIVVFPFNPPVGTAMMKGGEAAMVIVVAPPNPSDIV